MIVIDQTPGGSSAAVARAQLAGRPAIALQYVHAPEIGGAAEARNRAMELARGEYWLFLDDDVELERDFIAALGAALERHPELDGISGRVTNYSPPPRWRRLWLRVFEQGPFRDDRQPVYWGTIQPRGDEPLRVTRLGGGLMSFRAARIAGLRFDERLQGASEGEDVDFCLRLAGGGRLAIAPQARLRHLKTASGRKGEPALQQCSRVHAYLYWRHWRRQRVWYGWLNCGLGLWALAASLRRRSLAPWAWLWLGRRQGRQLAMKAGT